MSPFSLRPASFPRSFFLACTLLSAGTVALAQQPSAFAPTTPAPTLPAPAPPSAPPPPASLQPPSLVGRAQQASWHAEFTLDRSMLALAGNLYGVDDPTRQAVARVDGVAVHLYRFPAQRPYDPAAVESLRSQYGALGWKHVSTTSQVPDLTGETSSHTDVWLNTQGINLAGATILLAGPTTLNLITITGNLSTLDLLHLRGHFGIPRFPDDALPH